MGKSLEAGHRPGYGSRLAQHASSVRIDFDKIPPDLVESPVVTIGADESVEVACDVCRLCGCRAFRSRVYTSSLDPFIIRHPLFGHPSKGFLLSRPIRCAYPPRSPLLFLLTPSKHADVNAFLVLAATRNKSTKQGDPTDPNRAEMIIAAATAGRVPVQLVSSKVNLTGRISNSADRSKDLSDKNPLHVLPHDADLIDLLALFAEGAHRGAES